MWGATRRQSGVQISTLQWHSAVRHKTAFPGFIQRTFMNFMDIHPSSGGPAERINLSQFSVCINPKCRSSGWWQLSEKYTPHFAVQWDPLMIYQCCVLKDSWWASGKFQVKYQGSYYLALRSLFKSALTYHSMQWKHPNKWVQRPQKSDLFWVSEPQEWGIASFLIYHSGELCSWHSALQETL